MTTTDVNEPGRLLDFREAAAWLGTWCTERWVRRQVYDKGTLKAVRLGGRRLIPLVELVRFVSEAPAEAGKQSERSRVAGTKNLQRARAARSATAKERRGTLT